MSFIYTSQQVANAAVDLIAKNDATPSHPMEQHHKSTGGYFFTNKLLRNDYQEMINSMYNYQHNNYDYSMSSSSVSSLDSSYSSSRSSQLTNANFNTNYNAPLISTAASSQSTCSSPSASLDEHATCCLSDSSTSSLSSVHSASTDLAQNRSFQHSRLQNQPNWSSVIYTPHLYPMLYEPCDYYYSPPGFQHSGSYHNQLNQADFEELDQNVNDLINNNSYSTEEHKLLNKKLKDITNSESDSLFVMSKYGVKKWSQPQSATSNKCYYKKTGDMENRMMNNKRYMNNTGKSSNTLAYSAVVIRNPSGGGGSGGFVSNNNQGVEASKSYYSKKPSVSFNSAKQQQHVGVRGYGGVNKGYQYHYTGVNNGFNNNLINNTTQQQQQQQSSNRYRSSGHILLKTRS